MQEEIGLKEILKQLYAISGILIDVYDLEGHSLARYPDRGARFCSMVGHSRQGCKRCEQANLEAFATVRREHKVHIYPCHMGLYEAVVPLYHYGRLAGYMMTGQMLEDRLEAEEEVKRRAEQLKIGTKEEIEEAVKSLVRIDFKEMETFVTMCRICADYIANHHQFPVTATGTAKELCRYLEEHYQEKLTLEQLCRWFGYSKTRLNQLFRDYTGTSVYHYLTQLRLNKSCLYLRSSGQSVYSISLACGFSSQNFFSRQFKKYMGCTPADYRKKAMRENGREQDEL